jgi:hypothetical protein
VTECLFRGSIAARQNNSQKIISPQNTSVLDYNQARKKLDIVDNFDIILKDNLFLKSEGYW